jgi:hypothetical protein
MKRQLLVGLSLVVTLCSCGSGNTQRAQGTPGSGVAHQNQGTANHPNGPVGGQQDVQVVSSGFSSLPGDQYGRKPEVTYAAVFRNPNPTTWFAQAAVRFSFRDASGTEIKSQPDTLNVLPGQMAALGGSVEAADVTRLEVQALVSSWQQLPGGAGAFTVDA